MARSVLDPGILGTSFAAKTTTGAGDEFALQPRHGDGPRQVSWTVRFPGAAPAAQQTDLQGSIDGVNWFQLDTYNSVANGTLRPVVDKSVNFLRSNLITITTPNGGVTSEIAVY